MSEPISWADLIASARRKAIELSKTDSAPLNEVTAAVDELVEVVLVQQELIENLLVRMTRLEQSANPQRKHA